MRSTIFISALLLSNFIYAEEIYPSGCLPVVIKGNSLILSAEKYNIIAVHNLSKGELWVINPGYETGFNPLSSKLQAEKWSSLVLNKQLNSYILNCIESSPGHEQQISCRDTLAVCYWPKALVPENRKGIFWIGEDMDMLPLTAYLWRLGFSLS
ncbi:MAG: hypothetical protein A3E88_04855 [Legionellales bacterium RIFCSPHIGHO2_12_FULL_35_11]|nr:MAG: hypothetical protein A3E88_04855 [Legionellales bacterium RIFCSPHIGHO2_12_FULL_35_11]